MVVLHGERARGRYVLFQTKDNQWMIHRMDPPEDPDRQPMPEGWRPMLATPATKHPQGRGELFVRGEVGRDPGAGLHLGRADPPRGPQRQRRQPPLPGAARARPGPRRHRGRSSTARSWPSTRRPAGRASNGSSGACTWSRRAPSAASARTCRSPTPSSTSSGSTGIRRPACPTRSGAACSRGSTSPGRPGTRRPPTPARAGPPRRHAAGGPRRRAGQAARLRPTSPASAPATG